MAHIGVTCLPMLSHMNLFLALGEELQARGHQLTFFNLPENKARIVSMGFEFASIEPEDLPSGTLGRMIQDMGKASPLAAMTIQGRFDYLRYRAILTQLPPLLQELRPDGMIVDQAEACSGSVAEMATLPWVSVASGLCLNSEPLVPPFFISWPYSQSRLSAARNQLAYAGLRPAMLKTTSLINRFRTQWGLKRLTRMDDTFSPMAQICQQIPEFDFPRRELPDCFHYVGPITSEKRNSIDFPWNRIDGRPLIYASLGTLLNRHRHLYRTIAESGLNSGSQIVISLGGAGMEQREQDFPGSPIVVNYAPQLDLLARASLTITHAGLNTTLESLRCGVPLVAIPISFEQPGIAARIRFTGAGELLKMSRVSVPRLRACISRVLQNPAYKRAAMRLGDRIRMSRGRQKAADIIEEVMRTKAPVTAR